MTLARTVIAGSTVMLTRRTERRHYLLRPDGLLTQFYLYSIAVLAAKYGILVHAIVLMSTHEHIVITDLYGNRPRFVRDLHRLVALAVKCIHKWEGGVWDGGETSVVDLDQTTAIVDKLGYVIANPVTAGAVKQPKHWPGVCTLADDMGQKVFRIARPGVYFDEANPQWPEMAELRIVMPQALIDTYGSEERAREAVHDAVEGKVAQAHDAARQRKWRFQGAVRAKLCSPYSRATSYEPLRKRNPTFAVGSGQRSAFFESAAKLRIFRSAYREALAAWRAGDRDVVFPYGTWAMAVYHGAKVATGPAG